MKNPALRLFCLLCTLSCIPDTFAQPVIQLIDVLDQQPHLSTLDQQYIQNRMDGLDLSLCRQSGLGAEPRLIYRKLSVPHGESTLYLNVQADVMRTNSLVLYEKDENGNWREYSGCPVDVLLPVLAIMSTARISGDEIGSNRVRQTILARHTQLSSHEPSKLMLRTDSDDINQLFLDFTVSTKHTLFPNLVPLVRGQEVVADVLERVVPGDSEYLMQLYLSFTGRFSQYVGTRDSSPVVSRRFNPTVFYRLWTSGESWLDLGFAHESNGQRVDDPEAFRREQQDYINHGEPAAFARDSLSRGWDYSMVEWKRVWTPRISTQLKLRHYLDKGPLQGPAEEYNTWEDGGTKVRPRRQFDGVSLELQYDFNRSRCFVGDYFICFKDMALTQETGYSAMFKRNTTTIEFTTDVLGLPIQLWAKTGYNSDLVDYYNYTNSWGLGFELVTP